MPVGGLDHGVAERPERCLPPRADDDADAGGGADSGDLPVETLCSHAPSVGQATRLTVFSIPATSLL